MKKSGVLGKLILFISIILTFLLPIKSYALSINKSKLPDAVSSNISSTVDIEYYTPDSQQFEKASGVKISPNLTISAGHEFLLNGPIGFTSNSNYCRALYIYSKGDFESLNSTESSVVATFNSNSSSQPDISIINTDGNSNFKKLPVPIIGGKPTLNSKVYFVNYEPDANLIDRNPNVDANTSTISKIYSQPAIYNGLVVDNSSSGYTIATGMDSLGMGVPDNISRPGASGGPVYNEKGQLIGIVTAVIPNKLSASEVNSIYNNSQLKSANMLQLEQIQPITPELVKEYIGFSNSINHSNSSLPVNTSVCSKTQILKTVSEKHLYTNFYTTFKNNINIILATAFKRINF